MLLAPSCLWWRWLLARVSRQSYSAGICSKGAVEYWSITQCSREFGRLLHDGFHHQLAEGCWNSRLEGISPCPQEAIFSNVLCMPHLKDIVANIIGVWPLIISYLKETGHKNDGDSLVVKSSSSMVYNYNIVPLYIVFMMFRWRRWTVVRIWTSSRASISVYSRCCSKFVSVWPSFCCYNFGLRGHSGLVL